MSGVKLAKLPARTPVKITVSVTPDLDRTPERYADCAVGFWCGFAALHSGSGVVVAFAIGFVAGAIVFGVGQSVWNSRRPRVFRYAIVLLFVVPAVWTVIAPRSSFRRSLYRQPFGEWHLPLLARLRWV